MAIFVQLPRGFRCLENYRIGRNQSGGGVFALGVSLH